MPEKYINNGTASIHDLTGQGPWILANATGGRMSHSDDIGPINKSTLTQRLLSHEYLHLLPALIHSIHSTLIEDLLASPLPPPPTIAAQHHRDSTARPLPFTVLDHPLCAPATLLPSPSATQVSRLGSLEAFAPSTSRDLIRIHRGNWTPGTRT